MQDSRFTVIDAAENLRAVEEIWRRLDNAANDSFFLSWSWIENWLALVAKESKVNLAVLEKYGEPKMAFFLGSKRILRHRVLPSRAVFLNQTGVGIFDDLYIEHNGVNAQASGFSLGDLLRQLPFAWDEFFLNGVGLDKFPGNSLQQDLAPYRVTILAERPCPFVDLELVRENKNDYLALLSANTRSQIRRSYRVYEERGPIRCEVARSLPEFLAIFEELVRLHQFSWQARGQTGAFASPFLYRFHNQLIRNRCWSGEIQLLRISAGDSTIGCLYSFVYRGRVHFYQGGLAYEADKKLKPGLVCHAEAVRLNAAAGNHVYDFLAGEARYKESLATGRTTMLWAKIQKQRAKFWLEDRAIELARTLRSRHNHSPSLAGEAS